MTPDAHVLVAAFRTDHPHHSIASAWLHSTLDGIATGRTRQSLSLLAAVVVGFLRTTTDPQIVKQPDSLDAAAAFVDALLDCPGVVFQASGIAWTGFRQLCIEHSAQADWVSDAWIAACVLQSGDTLCTFDRDFQSLLPSHQLHLLRP